MNKIIFSIVVLALSGCASTEDNPVDCNGQNDWHKIGFNLASEGKNVRSHDAYIKQCKITLLESEQEEYFAGYYMGLADFCTHEKGKEYGSAGLDFPTVCPYELRETIQAGYDLGAKEYLEKRARLAHDDRMREQRGHQTGSNSASMGN